MKFFSCVALLLVIVAIAFAAPKPSGYDFCPNTVKFACKKGESCLKVNAGIMCCPHSRGVLCDGGKTCCPEHAPVCMPNKYCQMGKSAAIPAQRNLSPPWTEQLNLARRRMCSPLSYYLIV
eukprot:TRINITY_DN27291_c0_g2_i3.p3 TRINITY_DN27291_c0_g2~~TRINITY_DN27291_c0_g2_i3.p3  ORF type:complete len:121 (-),score=21.42 TRINITY_DN27291_c0_g2_i3:236-598(-)